MEICERCNPPREFKTIQAKRGHERRQHGIHVRGDEAASSAPADRGGAMASQPETATREYVDQALHIKDLERELVELRPLREGNANLQKKIGEMFEHDTLVPDLIAHCEDGSCGVHAQQWKQVREDVVTKALKELPDQFYLDEAIKRGVLPDKIEVQVP